MTALFLALLFVTNERAGTLTVIDGNKTTATVRVGAWGGVAPPRRIDRARVPANGDLERHGRAIC